MVSCMPQLVSALSSKSTALEELIALLQDEQRSIIEIDLAGLESLDARKRELLTSMGRNNAECRLLLKAAAEELKIEKTESLSPLISKVAPPLRDTLKGLQSRLLELGDTLNKILDFNRELLEGSLRHVRESMEFLNSFFTRRSTYGEAGGMLQSSNGVRLVCKEI
jgi:flagellar biosynthesis/type III secretory pathway chaperone